MLSDASDAVFKPVGPKLSCSLYSAAEMGSLILEDDAETTELWSLAVVLGWLRTDSSSVESVGGEDEVTLSFHI
jgi:hypothetical protein